MAQKPEKTAEPKKAADMEPELFDVHNIIGLAAFAAEARRVLGEIHATGQALPKFGEDLGRLVTGLNDWTDFPNTLPWVLSDVHRRLGVLLDGEN